MRQCNVRTLCVTPLYNESFPVNSVVISKHYANTVPLIERQSIPRYATWSNRTEPLYPKRNAVVEVETPVVNARYKKRWAVQGDCRTPEDCTKKVGLLSTGLSAGSSIQLERLWTAGPVWPPLHPQKGLLLPPSHRSLALACHH